MRDDLPDEVLMDQVAREDAAAFDALFVRHRRGVFHYTLRMVSEHALAEDLTQEAFLRVWRARHSYRIGASFRAWLFTIARRVALDELRKRRLPTVRLSPDGDTDPRAACEPPADRSGADPVDAVVARELERVIDVALDRLPEPLREVVILRDAEGMSYEEMAQVVGCPLGTIKSRLSAARARLRDAAAAWLDIP
ncbi:MAG: sigma-70 family RNA polymerase sigma factor [Armatimonadetes bacterium]|nr:sigma-70 family RNA polymerase sigma factor [Armatimonadota bacterium]